MSDIPLQDHVVGKPDLHEPTLEAVIFELGRKRDSLDRAMRTTASDSLSEWFAGQKNGVVAAIQVVDLLKRPDFQAAGHYKYHGD